MVPIGPFHLVRLGVSEHLHGGDLLLNLLADQLLVDLDMHVRADVHVGPNKNVGAYMLVGTNDPVGAGRSLRRSRRKRRVSPESSIGTRSG